MGVSSINLSIMTNKNLIHILFFPFKPKLNKRNECPLKCRITYLKVRKEFSTGLFINPKHWDKKNQIIPNDENIMSHISLINSNIKNSFLKLRLSNCSFTVIDIYKDFKGEIIAKDKGVLEFFNEYLLKIKKLIGIEIKLVTWVKYNYDCNHVKNFIRWKYNKSDFLLNELNLNFLNELDYYLKTEKKQKQVSINKTIQRLRKVVREAYAEKYIKSNPFMLFKPKTVRNQVVYLSVNELKKIENHYFNQKRLEQVRDCFIFCCYTGLAFQEMSSLRNKHIAEGFDGNLWIQMNRAKTSKPISIPMLPKAIDIIDKYMDLDSDFVLPKLSNQKFNSYLKEIAIIVNINKRVTHHTARKTFATTVLLFNDVPMEIVSELLGHSNMKITQEYYGKIVQKKVSESIFKLKNKLDNQ